MPEQLQLEKDIAALRSHVIDGIEELKASTDNVDAGIMLANKLLNRLFTVGLVVTILVAIYIVRHW
jgi:hypothetical protein